MSTRAYLAAQLLNASFSAVSAGLTLACITSLVGEKAMVAHPRGTRLALIAYVAAMGGIAFAAIVYDSVRFVAFIQHLTDIVYHDKSVHPVQYFEDDILRVVLPVAMWGAEAFMAWRVYVHVRPDTTLAAFILGALFTAIAILSIVSSIPVLKYNPVSHQYGEFLSAYRFFSASAAVINLTMSMIIAVKLIFWDRIFEGIESTWKARGRTFARLMIASGALITTVSILAGCFYKPWTHDWMVIPMFVLPQICVISPLLIVCSISESVDESIIRLPDSPPAELSA